MSRKTLLLIALAMTGLAAVQFWPSQDDTAHAGVELPEHLARAGETSRPAADRETAPAVADTDAPNATAIPHAEPARRTAPAAGQAGRPSRDDGVQPVAAAMPRGSDPYALLIDRNIFLRNRRPPAPPRPTPTEDERRQEADRRRPAPPPPPPDPGLDYALRGVAVQGSRRIAFLEHRKDRTYRSVQVGDQIAGRTVAFIELDYVEFSPAEEVEGEAVSAARITMGHDLTGQAAPAAHVAGLALPSSPMTTLRTNEPARGPGGRGNTRGGARGNQRGAASEGFDPEEAMRRAREMRELRDLERQFQ